MSIVNAPIEGAVLIGGTVGNGGVAFSDGFHHVVGKSSPVRITHCGDSSTVYDDVVLSSGEQGASEGFYMPGMDGVISVIGEQSKIWGGNYSRTSALGNNSEIELNYMTPPSTPDFPLEAARAFVAGYSSRINARDVVKDSVLIAAGENCQINDEGRDNTIICAGNDGDIIAGEHSLVIVTNSKCSFNLSIGAVAVFCWNDGAAKHVKIVREGEDGILAGTAYTFDNGVIA
ncbi:hypothetical protein SB6411_04193 [Klebsiella spallanzanii]|uniref:Uncharacterized protein n=1 Tax=Klebsiella spallanzanii TaxID=2587528 RepID=A0ABY6VSZ1_9ENTR|nr:hypothetical protein [Klebsiella spallanzanii]MDM4206945.1 hypothetical protein [Klebsiella spallanzanii]VUT02181.1 hypothetical protein SB6411_04193 [Klebsiella spallanzanii]